MTCAPDLVHDSDGGIYLVDPQLFRHVLGYFLTGVTVVSAMRGSTPVGLTVGSFFSVSLDPPLVGFCASNTSATWPAIKDAGRFCVNVLAAGQEDLGRRFAISSGDKFRGVSWTVTGGGSPRLANVLAWVDCELYAVHQAGDHEICLGRVTMLGTSGHRQPLLFFRGEYVAGRSPAG
jgi:3-hydroxy-9,10-secoandrosta-1,3,5(10)-triene-9,17-dione monooxygenase reductase component